MARNTAHGEQREQLLKMAATWDSLAQERERRSNGNLQSPENE